MRNKKTLTLPCVAIVAFASIVCLKAFGANVHKSNNLLMENVEALASGEASSETSPEINCDASNNRKCQFYCGLCKKNINGSGATTGSHSCKK